MIKKHIVSCTLILTFLIIVTVALLSSASLGLESAWADSMVKNIHVGDAPTGVAFDSANGYTYVTNTNSNTVSVIDGSTNTVIKEIHVGSHPRGIAFDSDNGNLYVANEGSYTVSVIDGSTNTVIDTIPVDE
ncbi:MAG: YncE family protein [Nitrososphaeraceae archaeon]